MPAKRKTPSRARRLFGGVMWFAWAASLLLVGTVLGWLGTSSRLSKSGFDIVRSLTQPPEDVFKQNAMNILILGCDEDLYYGGKQVLKPAARSDMMLVARLDFTHKRISGISIPRDTRSQMPGDIVRKINAYHAVAPRGQGPDLARRAVEHLLDDQVKIDRVVVVDYDAFMRFVDLIGGVDVSTPIDLKYIDRAGGLYIDIPKGTHRLNGYDAMGFVRIRKHAGDDYMRQDRQKQVLLGVKNQIAHQPTRIPAFVDAGVKVLGDTFDIAEITALASFARNVPKEEIKMGALPTHPGHGSFLEVSPRSARKMLAEYGMVTGETAVARG